MRLAGNKKLLLFSGLLLLALLLVLPVKHLMTDVFADQTSYTVKLLEITDTGISDLRTGETVFSNMSIYTISMKRFVALRDDLDGKYDAIYIGKGIYNKSAPVSATDNPHDTMNDMTSLKAQEIIDLYINKGLYVFFHTDAFLNQTTEQHGVLYNTFNVYRTTSKRSNVVFVNDMQLPALITDLNSSSSKYAAGLNKRPHLALSNRAGLIDYSPDSHIYNTGDTLTFKFNISNISNIEENPVSAKLYLSGKEAPLMTEANVVAAMTISQESTEGVLTYKLPAAYSSLLHWKLEISSSSGQSSLKDYDSGSIRYRGNQAIIKVLQVGTGVVTLPDSLLHSEDYQLGLSSMSINDFNAYISSNNNAGLNGVYDSLILNFSDVYKTSSPLSAAALTTIKQFSNQNKQSVLYLLDASTQSTGSWAADTVSLTGQQNPELIAAPGTSGQAGKVTTVNGLVQLQYPVYAGAVEESSQLVSSLSNLILSGTRNSALTLNLEDPDVMPWYTLASESGDANDSWNQYLAYSKGNNTYMGTPQLFAASSPAQLQTWNKLLVNAIHSTFIAANHAPVITVQAPTAAFPSYQQQFILNYSVVDPDYSNSDLHTSVKFKSNGSYLTNISLADSPIKSGGSIYNSFPNPLPNGGTLEVEITTYDELGAVSFKSFNVVVTQAQSPKANLNITKRITSTNVVDGKVAINEPFTIEYTMTPTSIPVANVNAADRTSTTLVVSDVNFEDVLPPNIELVGDLPAAITSKATAGSGITLTKNFGSISYNLNPGKTAFEPVTTQTYPITLSIQAKAVRTGYYSLGQTTLNFEDIHSVAVVPTATVAPTPTPTPMATAQPAATFDPVKSTSSSSLGVAGDYNAFVFGESKVTASLKGNIASGGNVTARAVDINMANKDTVPYAIVAGGDLNFTNGTVYGNILHQGEFTKLDSGTIQNGNYKRGTLYDFGAARTYYRELSSKLAALIPNGTVEEKWGGILVTGTKTVNIFSFPAEFFDRTSYMNITAPAGSTLIFNITGDVANMDGGLELPSNVTGNKIIYNFPTASRVNISSITIKGSILAPRANVQFTGGDIYGHIISETLTCASNLVPLRFTEILPVTVPTATPTASPVPIATPTVAPTPSPTPVPTPLPRVTQSFPALPLEVVQQVTGIQIQSDHVTIYVGETRKLIATVTPTDATNQRLLWESDIPSTVSVDTNTGVITGRAEGTAQITVRATDRSGVSSRITVTVKPAPALIEEVVNRSVVISGLTTAKVGDNPIDLEAVYSESDESGITYSWKVQGAELGNGSKMSFTPTASGIYSITVTVTSDSNPGETMDTHTITVTNPPTSISITGGTSVFSGKTIQLDLVIEPAGTDPITINDWTLTTGGDYATIEKVSPTRYIFTAGNAAGKSVTIHASAGSLEAEHTVDIVGLEELVFYPNSRTIYVGDEATSLLTLLIPRPSGIQLNDIIENLTWSNQYDQTLKLDADGTITAKTPGDSLVTVKYHLPGTDNKTDITAQIMIRVKDKEAVAGDRY